MMKQKMIKILIFGIALLVLMGFIHTKTEAESKMCIPPPFKVAIPKFVPMEGYDDIIPPQNGWREAAQIPEGYENSSSNLIFSGGNIWIKMWHIDPNSTDSYPVIGDLNIHKGTWKIYDEIANYKKTGPRELFVDLTGSIYGLDYGERNAILISKYDKDTDQFEPVYTNNKSGISYRINWNHSNPIADRSGNIWLNLKADGAPSGIYRFDPDKKELIYSQPADLKSVSQMALAPNNDIYMIASPSENYDYRFYEINPEDGVAKGTNIQVEELDNLYLDKESYLWISDKSFRKVTNDGEWGMPYEVIRSPVFTSSNSLPWNKYSWVRPAEMFQSSDGTYWFAASNVGTVSLDMKTEEWCLFTNAPSSVVEDNDKNVWMIIKNTLYKKNLE